MYFCYGILFHGILLHGVLLHEDVAKTRITFLAQSVGAAEYTDCFSAEG